MDAGFLPFSFAHKKRFTTVNGRRNIIIAVGAIVLFAAMVGFFITLNVSPQIAYARLFIDAGLIIGLVAVIMAFYKEEPLPLDGLLHALKSIKQGKYKTKITLDEKDQLKPVAAAINELAQSLEKQFLEQEEIKRNLREELLPGLKQKEITVFEHSFHPELGPVCNISGDEPKAQEKTYDFANSDRFTVRPMPKTENHGGIQNPLIDSNPPPNQTVLPKIKPSLQAQEQDLGELFEKFIDAQRQINVATIEYPSFLRTIEKTKNELMDAHHCKNVIFDIVKEERQIALQPRIIR